MSARRVLILGGTVEAVELAKALDDDPRFEPITSLAGRTRHPAVVPGATRTGGFGGVEGLADYLGANAIDALVDATHPYAARITQNAVAACEAAGIPRLRLERPPWSRQSGDHWIDVSDSAEAARHLPDNAKRVFLAIGRQDLEPFSCRPDIWFLLRVIDPPDPPPDLDRHEVVLGRGPFAVWGEIDLLTQNRIDTIVSKNSGGEATYAKIIAARQLGLPVVMIARPDAPAGETVETAEAALGVLRHRFD